MPVHFVTNKTIMTGVIQSVRLCQLIYVYIIDIVRTGQHWYIWNRKRKHTNTPMSTSGAIRFSILANDTSTCGGAQDQTTDLICRQPEPQLPEAFLFLSLQNPSYQAIFFYC